MIQTVTDHNVNADHFFKWMERHWKYYVGSAADKREILSMFEDEAPSGEFNLPGSATNDGEPHAYTDFYRQWFETEDGDDYRYFHGSNIPPRLD